MTSCTVKELLTSTQPCSQVVSAMCPDTGSAESGTVATWTRTQIRNLVELRGFEPLTSCMPSVGSASTAVRLCRSPSQGVRTSPVRSAPVAVLSRCTSQPRPASPSFSALTSQNLQEQFSLQSAVKLKTLADRESISTWNSLGTGTALRVRVRRGSETVHRSECAKTLGSIRITPL